MEGSSARSGDSHRSAFRPGGSADGGEQRETTLEELEHFPTRRSICIGLLIAAFIAVVPPYVRIAARTANPPAHGLLTIIVMAAAANFVAKLLSARFRLSARELIFVMMISLMAMSFVLGDMPLFLIWLIASPYYFASPANQWGTYLLPNLPAHLFPHERGRTNDRLLHGSWPGRGDPVRGVAWAAVLVVFAYGCNAAFRRVRGRDSAKAVGRA